MEVVKVKAMDALEIRVVLYLLKERWQVFILKEIVAVLDWLYISIPTGIGSRIIQKETLEVVVVVLVIINVLTFHLVTATAVLFRLGGVIAATHGCGENAIGAAVAAKTDK